MNILTKERILLLCEAHPDDRKTLAAIRSLAKAGYHLTLASDSFRGRSFHSRHIHERILIPHPATDFSGFMTRLQELMGSGDYAAILPTSDYVTFALSQNKDDLPNAHQLPIPGYEATAICKDKRRTGEFASNLGLEIPRTYCPEDREALVKTFESLKFPCILKPRVTAGSIGMSIASTREELLQAYDSLPSLANMAFDFSNPLVQEQIDGEVHEVCALFNQGKARAALTQRRLLMYPAAGGAGIYNETTDEPELKEQALRLLEALNWHGLAQVEFIRDSITGKSYLLEVNGRLWGTMDLSIEAGMDFPTLACRMVIDGDIDCQWTYRVGQRFRWPFPFALLHIMETGRWAETIRDFLLPRRSTASDLSLSDPKPLFMEFLYTLDRFRKRRFKTLRSEQAWSEIILDDTRDRE